ncbi:nuclear transport factor 2 family protein [Curtobacterium flaccumfaciens]|uniref:nuclear transport factor 2 family protein n=1 Tax=Curtobacterium flaccumfaciens TaxID=2035 RepID=UPI00341A5B75
MSQASLETKAELAELVTEFANLADENRIHEQMALFTPDATVQIWIGDHLLFDVAGTDTIEQTFTEGTANVVRSFHMLGQQAFQVDGDTAEGLVYCQVKLVSVEAGAEVVADSSIRYSDTYARVEGRWLITSRVSRFTIVDRRAMGS